MRADVQKNEHDGVKAVRLIAVIVVCTLCDGSSTVLRGHLLRKLIDKVRVVLVVATG